MTKHNNHGGGKRKTRKVGKRKARKRTQRVKRKVSKRSKRVKRKSKRVKRKSKTLADILLGMGGGGASFGNDLTTHSTGNNVHASNHDAAGESFANF